jgi:cytochrome c-type biogenesis protein CcmH/NrfG
MIRRKRHKIDPDDAITRDEEYRDEHKIETGSKEEKGSAGSAGFLSAFEDERECAKTVGKHTKAIQILRAAVLVLLVLAASLVCTLVFLFTKNDERVAFERAYEAEADRISDSFHDAVINQLQSINSLST